MKATERTKAQKEDSASRFGPKSIEWITPAMVCSECGAIPGYVHPASCNSNKHPELSTGAEY
jgi:hypothetical protein